MSNDAFLEIAWEAAKVVLLPLTTTACFLSLVAPCVYRKRRFIRVSHLDLADETVQSAFTFSTFLLPTSICMTLLFFLTSDQPTALTRLVYDDQTLQHVTHCLLGLFYIFAIFARKCWAGRIDFELFWTFLLIRLLALIVHELSSFVDAFSLRTVLNVIFLLILTAIAGEALVLFGFATFIKGESNGPYSRQFRELVEPLLSPDRLEAATPPPKAYRQGRELDQGIGEYLTYSFVSPVISFGYKNELSRETFPNLGEDEDPETTYRLFLKHWRFFRNRPNCLWIALWSFVAPRFITTGCCELLHSIFEAIIPLVLKGVLDTLVLAQSDVTYVFDAFIYVGLLVVTCLTGQIMVSQFEHNNCRFAIRVRQVMESAVFDKSLTLNLAIADDSPDKPSRGKIVNMVSVDANQAQWACNALHHIWSCPLQVLLQFLVLYHQLGWPAFVCLCVMLGSVPTAKLIFGLQGRFQERILGKKDERIKVTSEILAGLRAVKMYAWEEEMYRKTCDMRKDELRDLWKYQMANVGSSILWNGTPVLMSLTVFGLCTFMSSRTEFDTPTLLTGFAILGKIAGPMSYLPLCAAAISEGRTVLRRLEKFLTLPEVKPRAVVPVANPAVRVADASIAWPQPPAEPPAVALPLTPWQSAMESAPLLKNVSFAVPCGTHFAITGRTGSGKTTLLTAILGDLPPLSGSVTLTGSVAYVAQQAWLQDGTIMANILFGEPFDRRKYMRVLDATELRADLDVLPNADLTLVGERGVSLSGGQKQRVCLARALYRDAEVYVLDDIFSALDTHTAEAVFEKAFRCSDLLQEKTVVLATHRLEILNHFDNVAVITETGEVTAADPAALTTALTDDDSELDTPCPVRKRSTHDQAGHDLNDSLATLTTDAEEALKLGGVDWSVYVTWINAAGGCTAVTALVGSYLIRRALQVAGALWFAAWANRWSDSAARVPGFEVLATLWTTEIVFVAVEASVMAVCAQRTGARFHDQLLDRFLHARLAFITATPMGRMLNRLSKDLNSIDQELPFVLSESVSMWLEVGGMITAAIIALPVVVVVLPPILYVYWAVQQRYVSTARQEARLEAAAVSPVISLVAEAVDGTAVIRAFNKQAFVKAEFFKRLAHHLTFSYFREATTRWVEVRLLLLSTALSISVTVICVVCVNQINIGLAGLVIAYSFMIPGALNWLVQMNADRESSMVAVERIQSYLDPQVCPQETTGDSVVEPVASWPAEGRVEIKNLSMRYRPELPLVLNKVSFEVEPGEKVGVVGRTGAGKSSLLVALLRLVEPEPGSEVFIDNVPADRVDHRRLRQAVAVIPQDPTLFTGTVRSNLDPAGSFDDQRLWETLKHSCLADFVRSLPGALNAPVEEGGSNFSVGQRQLICLARVLLRQAQILLLDEATSSVDPTTDEIIQNTLKQEFNKCTVICIAHRLNTIAHYDKIAVMSDGELVEYGPPEELLRIPGGHYAGMVGGEVAL